MQINNFFIAFGFFSKYFVTGKNKFVKYVIECTVFLMNVPNLDRRMEEEVRNVGEITKCNIKKENQKLESKSSQKSSSTHKIPETQAKKQEEGVRKALPSTKVRKRIQSLEKKLVRKTGDGEKRKLEEKLEEDEQSRGKGDREGGKEDKYMGEKPGGRGGS